MNDNNKYAISLASTLWGWGLCNIIAAVAAIIIRVKHVT
jgi:hypothetical protein